MQLQALLEVGRSGIEIIGVLAIAFSLLTMAGDTVMAEELFPDSLLTAESFLTLLPPEYVHQRIFQGSLLCSPASRYEQTRRKDAGQ